ncbi:MAG: hypothetical protein A2636_02975 [Elusimicrobia bacterium RIFCSPHIGHO2_01_FULL_64_10]|nr:MAG: hypothetical protein A2636_02975 [Elusimicrobia bacterium RIFCSPHIGHO2_01_FULL_64_10]
MNLYKRLAPLIKPYLTRLIEAAVCMGLVALFTTIPIWLIRSVMDDVILAKDLQKLLLFTVLFPLVYLLKGVFSYLQNYLMNYIGQSVVRDMRLKIYSHLQTLSMDFFHKNSTGGLMSRVTNDTTTFQIALVQVPVQIVRDGLTLVFLTGTIFYLHWKFALITLFLFPIAAVPVWILGRKLRASGRQIQSRMSDLFGSLHEGISGHAITKVFGKEAEEIRRFRKENDHYYSVTMRWVRANVLGAPIMEFLGSLAAIFLLWYGGRDVIEGRWTLGSFGTFLGAFLSAYKPVKDFTSVNAQIQQGAACAERIFEILDERPTVVECGAPEEIPPFRGSIEYAGVGFSYALGNPVLKKIDMTVRAGEVIALVGPSGAGKTTLTKLLPRLMDPQEGAIRIDGVELRRASLASLRRQIGIVTQDVILFNETVRYNIAYGGTGSPGERSAEMDRRIEDSAKIANAHDFILALPRGYDTVIGERGVRLSGGQRQRLSIARAVIKNPPILILDEATSSLDAESEKLVQEAMGRLMESRTVLVIAHRLSTIRRADRILVLDGGEIVEEGDHDLLWKKAGQYKRLYEMQLLA